MSLLLNIHTVSPEHQKQIAKKLIVRPTVDYFAKQKGLITKPVNLLKHDDDYLYLPLHFCRTYLKQVGRPRPKLLKTKVKTDFAMKEVKLGVRKGIDQAGIIKEAKKIINNNKAVLLDLPPGTGKTFLTVYLSSLLGMKTIVLMHRDLQLKQWRKEYRTWTKTDPLILTKDTKDEQIFNCQVLLVMVKRIKYLPEKYYSLFGTLAVDEMHSLCTKDGINAMSVIRPAIMIGLTATPERSDGMEKIIHYFIGKEKYWVSRDAKHVKLKIKQIDSGFKFGIPKNVRGDTDFTKLQHTIFNYKPRNLLIIEQIKKVVTGGEGGSKVFVITSYMSHIRTMVKLWNELIKDDEELSEIKYDIYAGNKKSYKEGQVLFCTMGKIGEAFDEKNFSENFSGVTTSNMIIVNTFKDKTRLEQLVGRIWLRSTNPTVYEIIDDNRIVKNHARLRKKWYIANKAEIEVIKKASVMIKGEDDSDGSGDEMEDIAAMYRLQKQMMDS